MNRMYSTPRRWAGHPHGYFARDMRLILFCAGALLAIVLSADWLNDHVPLVLLGIVFVLLLGLICLIGALVFGPRP